MKKIALLFVLSIIIVKSSFCQIDTIFQEIPTNQVFDENTMVVKFQLVTPEGKMIANYPIRLFAPSLQKVFVAKTDEKAIARFYVPTKTEYHIGVGNVSNYQKITVMYEEPPILTKILKFAVSEVNEYNSNDTIFQTVKSTDKASSERALVIISVEDYDRKPLADENVYLQAQNSNLTYTSTTNTEGKAYFLLPKTDVYLLHLTYERNIRLISFPDFASLHTTSVHLTYVGTNRVNQLYDMANRTDDGFLKEFISSPVNQISSVESDYYTSTPWGYQLFKSAENPTSTPAFAFGNIYTGNGLYSTDYYCFDALTGKFKWGVQLADNGPSASVLTDSILLINTESCTLYALNAINGKLLWSKWLAPYLYTSPTVFQNRVITSYQANIFKETNFQLNRKIVVAFDLKTGNVAWQNWLDEEILGSAVGADSSIYITTYSGKLYKFSAHDGKLKAMNDMQAVSQPVIAGNNIYISARLKDNKEKYELLLVDAESLKVKKNFSKITGQVGFQTPHDLHFPEKLNFNGSRVLFLKEQIFAIIQGNLVAADAESGEIKWKVPVGENETMPVYAGGYLLVNSKAGLIKVIDPKSGKTIDTYRTGLPLFSQLIVWKGWIFSASSKNGIAAYKTGNSKLDGWFMWGKDASHNTAIP